MSALQTTGQAPELLRLSPTTFEAGFPDRASSDTPVQSDSWQRPARHPRGGLSQPALPALHPLWPQVHEDYDCTLNQTNIGNNNNKFYIIQLLEQGDCFFCWNRWGRVVSATHPSCAHPPHLSLLSACLLPPRVPTAHSGRKARATDCGPAPPLTPRGTWHRLAQQRPASIYGGHCGCRFQGEVGQSKLSRFVSLEDAKKDFEKKFRDKTKNSWAERDHFVAHPGKYTLIEVQREDEAQEVVVKVKQSGTEGGPGPREGTTTAWLCTQDRPRSLASTCSGCRCPAQLLLPVCVLCP